MKLKPFLMSAFATGACLLSNIASAGSFDITYEPANVMEAGPKLFMGKAIYGVETFDHASNGTYRTDFGTKGKIKGTYTGLTVKNADKYGGAKAEGKYAVTYNKAGYTLELSTDGVPGVNYFGFWLSALDAHNQLDFYQGNVKIASYKPEDLIKKLGSCGASDKATKPHCGNPNNVKNKNFVQQYAFVNFYYTGGYFNKVKFYQSGTGGYESDNHTVAYCSNIKACMSGELVTKEEVPTEKAQTCGSSPAWVAASNGKIPSGSLVGGNEANGEKLYVCRANYKGGVHPGKVRKAFGACNIGWGGKEVAVNPYEVLVQ